MKTIKIYLAPYVDKVHEKCLNSAGEPYVSKRYLTVPSIKNQEQAIVSKSTGKSFIKKSEQYIYWKQIVYPIFKQEADRIFNEFGVDKIIRAKIKIIFYFPNNVPRDLTNKADSIMDALRDVGIIYDDMFQVTNDNHQKGYICRNQPRTEIYIHIIEPTDQEYEIDKTNHEKWDRQKKDKIKAIREWCKK